MYGWGGSTDGWKGKSRYDYGSARARYDKLAADVSGPRVYSFRTEPDMKLVDPLGKIMTSDSENPIIIAVDVTGSMAKWPGEMFDRLPLLYQTLAKYREDLEIVFAAIGDATCDRYPLQVNDFAKGTDLEAKLKALGCEGGGGGHITESYELFGYFLQEHCRITKAKSPFLLIYGDETFYEQVDPRQVKHYIGDELQGPLDSREMWKNLMQRFNLYFLHKPYGNNDSRETTEKIGGLWKSVLGEQRVIELPYEIETEDKKIMPGSWRAVDIGMGLIAKHWGEYKDFTKSLGARHDDDDVKDAVHKSLRHIDDNPLKASVMPKAKSKATKSLL